MKKTILKYISVLIFFLLVTQLTDAQCSQCKAIVENGTTDEGSNIGAGLNFGILYLIAIPYLILFLLFRKKIVHLFKELRKMQ